MHLFYICGIKNFFFPVQINVFSTHTAYKSIHLYVNTSSYSVLLSWWCSNLLNRLTVYCSCLFIGEILLIFFFFIVKLSFG